MKFTRFWESAIKISIVFNVLSIKNTDILVNRYKITYRISKVWIIFQQGIQYSGIPFPAHQTEGRRDFRISYMIESFNISKQLYNLHWKHLLSCPWNNCRFTWICGKCVKQKEERITASCSVLLSGGPMLVWGGVAVNPSLITSLLTCTWFCFMSVSAGWYLSCDMPFFAQYWGSLLSAGCSSATSCSPLTCT